MFKQIAIAAILIIAIGGVVSAGEPYYVESDYNLTIPVNISANGVSYLFVELEGGFAPTTDVYDLWDPTLYVDDHIGTSFFDPKNRTFEAEVAIGSTSSTNKYGLANTSSATDAIYLELNTIGTDYAKLKSVVNGVTYEQTVSGYSYDTNFHPLTITTNATYATLTFDTYDTEIVTPITEKAITNFFDEGPVGNIKNQKMRKHFDDEPTTVSYQLSSTLTLVAITNNNNDQIVDYQVTVDGLFVDQTDESVNITAYDALDVPIPTSPVNNENLVFEYPPLVNDIDLEWTGTNATEYTYEVRSLGGTLLASGTTANNYTTIALSDGNYYWSVEGNAVETLDPILAYFTVSSTYVTDDYTAVVGTVYEMQNGIKTPLPESVVYIYNDTYSDHQTVGTDGYYSFIELAPSATYYVKASATDYDNSEISAVTASGGETAQVDILLVKLASQYAPHYVEYTVKNIFDSRYSGVPVDVYRGASVGSVPYRTGTTGADGGVSFRLDENQQYTLTFIDASNGINEVLTHYPHESAYNVYVVTTSLSPDEQYSSEKIDISVSKELINNSHAYINVTYLDNLAETESLKVYLNQSTTNDLFNQTVINSYSNVTNSATISFIVEDYAGETYFVNVDVDHTTFDKVKRSYAVQFDGMEDAHGFSQVYIWLAIGGIMFIGMLFKANNSRYGAFVVCIVAWVFIIMEWFDNLGDKGVLAITAATTLATILSIAAIMAKGEKEG
ncbi:MAG: hypothetical protein GQ576_07025 [Methanococcoides sp.]|nr:hypothetical protein [Methanococcoides sp.]